MERKCIHYGHKKFDKKQFVDISNCEYRPKPNGGLWASPIDSEFGWKQWCDSNKFRECTESDSFTFTLKPEANILVIDSVDNLKELPQVKSDFVIPMWYMLDFEVLSKKYDAIEVRISCDYNLYFKLYGWDCDSIVIMNPDVIVECK